MFSDLISTNPATLHTIWTTVTAVLLLSGGGLCLAMLPWTDSEINNVDRTINDIKASLTQIVHNKLAARG